MAPYDLVIYGATGFTGRLASLYAAKQYGTNVKWAIAGRSKGKLEGIKAECQNIPDILIADSADRAALDAMVAQTKVVAAFAGPFCRYGSELVAACTAAGVGYCDITGEIDWVREMIAKHDDDAKKSGARIVHLCGHDSAPWDLMAMKLAQKLKEGHEDSELARVDMYNDIKTAPSGGTLETAFEIMFGDSVKKSSSLGYDPLLKLPSGEASTYKVSAQNVGALDTADPAKHDAPRTAFVMAGVNANAVKRSNAINKYGSKVVYCEGLQAGSVPGALGTFAGLATFGLALYIPPARYLLRKFVLPKPGEGPSEEAMEKGYLNLTGVGMSTDGRTAKATLSFPVDPGYKDTARMCVESALAISLEGDRFPGGGVFTPACCQGEVLLERLLKTGSAFQYH